MYTPFHARSNCARESADPWMQGIGFPRILSSQEGVKNASQVVFRVLVPAVFCPSSFPRRCACPKYLKESLQCALRWGLLLHKQASRASCCENYKNRED